MRVNDETRGERCELISFREQRDRFISTDRGSKDDQKQKDTGSEALRKRKHVKQPSSYGGMKGNRTATEKGREIERN